MKRYIIVRDGDESEEIGIFHILNLLEEQDMSLADYGDLSWAERKFNLELNVPDYPANIKTEAWFTDKGVEVFEEALDILDILVGEYLSDYGYHFYELISNPQSNSRVMYSDKYQVVYYL